MPPTPKDNNRLPRQPPPGENDSWFFFKVPPLLPLVPRPPASDAGYETGGYDTETGYETDSSELGNRDDRPPVPQMLVADNEMEVEVEAEAPVAVPEAGAGVKRAAEDPAPDPEKKPRHP